MKKLLLLPFILSAFVSTAQTITGDWYGALEIMGTQLRITLHVTKTDNGYASTMDSPDQGVNGIPVEKTTFDNTTFAFEIPAGKIVYTGTLDADKIKGTFTQSGRPFPMELGREKIGKKELNRPQEPKPPYNYYTEEVTFENKKAKITLAGTLTLPKAEGKYPVVVMITGSGPQNRDEELMGHKPFLVIADHLTKNGIGVLRFDDRGTAKSTGDFKTATSVDFASDVNAAVEYLLKRKEVDKKKIGLIGHSEGGLIAPMVASKNKNVSYIVLLAGTGVKGGEILLAQQELIGRAGGATEEDLSEQHKTNSAIFDIIYKSANAEAAKKEITTYMERVYQELKEKEKIPEGMTKESLEESTLKSVTNPWMYYFIKYDPAPALEKTKCAVLAVNGSKDLQVPPKQNLDAIKKSLEKGKNTKVTTIEFPNLNHLFQECTTGSPEEYAKIEHTISPKVLDEITSWILLQTK
jgi:dienelactone hydrolase